MEALAVNGADTGDEIKLMQHLGEDHHDLDQVVLVACLNDIADIVPEWQAIARRVYQRAQHPGFLITHSYCIIYALYFRFVAALDPTCGATTAACAPPATGRSGRRNATASSCCGRCATRRVRS
ncbi:MAG: hypothetical protein U1E76_17010 [Planctomycetota bacterium]